MALGDEAVKSGPEVSLVGMAASLSRARKRLTWAAAGPDRAVVAPSGETERERPSSDAGEEVALAVAAQVVGTNIDD